jgi:hypothetical protein
MNQTDLNAKAEGCTIIMAIFLSIPNTQELSSSEMPQTSQNQDRHKFNLSLQIRNPSDQANNILPQTSLLSRGIMRC